MEALLRSKGYPARDEDARSSEALCGAVVFDTKPWTSEATGRISPDVGDVDGGGRGGPGWPWLGKSVRRRGGEVLSRVLSVKRQAIWAGGSMKRNYSPQRLGVRHTPWTISPLSGEIHFALQPKPRQELCDRACSSNGLQPTSFLLLVGMASNLLAMASTEHSVLAKRPIHQSKYVVHVVEDAPCHSFAHQFPIYSTAGVPARGSAAACR